MINLERLAYNALTTANRDNQDREYYRFMERVAVGQICGCKTCQCCADYMSHKQQWMQKAIDLWLNQKVEG